MYSPVAAFHWQLLGRHRGIAIFCVFLLVAMFPESQSIKRLISLYVVVWNLFSLWNELYFLLFGDPWKSAYFLWKKGRTPEELHQPVLALNETWWSFLFFWSLLVREQSKKKSATSSLILASTLNYFDHFDFIAVNIRLQLLGGWIAATYWTNRYPVERSRKNNSDFAVDNVLPPFELQRIEQWNTKKQLYSDKCAWLNHIGKPWL